MLNLERLCLHNQKCCECNRFSYKYIQLRLYKLKKTCYLFQKLAFNILLTVQILDNLTNKQFK